MKSNDIEQKIFKKNENLTVWTVELKRKTNSNVLVGYSESMPFNRYVSVGDGYVSSISERMLFSQVHLSELFVSIVIALRIASYDIRSAEFVACIALLVVIIPDCWKPPNILEQN